jgi:hypothetical protein
MDGRPTSGDGDSRATEPLASGLGYRPCVGRTAGVGISTRCCYRKPQDLRHLCLLGTPEQGGLLRAQVLRIGFAVEQPGAVHISDRWSRRSLEASGLDVFRSVYLRCRVAGHEAPTGVHDDSVYARREWSMGRVSIERRAINAPSRRGRSPHAPICLAQQPEQARRPPAPAAKHIEPRLAASAASAADRTRSGAERRARTTAIAILAVARNESYACARALQACSALGGLGHAANRRYRDSHTSM